MPKITLTAAAVEKLRPGTQRREIPDTGTKGLSLVIQPSGSKSWAMRFRRPDGKMAKLTLGPVDLTGVLGDAEPELGCPLTLAAARRLAAKVKDLRARGRDVIGDIAAEKLRRADEKRSRQQAANIAALNTFASEARRYVEEGRRTKEHNRGWRNTAKVLGLLYAKDGVEPTFVKGGLADRWRNKPITDVTADDVHAVVEEARLQALPGQRPRRPGPSDSRARDMVNALQTMFRWLVKRRRIKTNPSTDLDKPGPARARHRVLNTDPARRGADELRWFWAAAGDLGEPFGPMVKLLLLTGARRREASDMRWSELSDDLASWSLEGDRTKNGRPHVVTLPPAAQDLLKGMKRIAGPAGYVFTTNGRSPVSGFSRVKERLDSSMLQLAQEEAGRPVAIVAWRLHDLRRTAATGMAEIGVAPHIVEAVLNHVSGAQSGVAGVYNRASYAAEKRQALEAWAGHVTRIVEGGKVVPFTRRALA